MEKGNHVFQIYIFQAQTHTPEHNQSLEAFWILKAKKKATSGFQQKMKLLLKSFRQLSEAVEAKEVVEEHHLRKCFLSREQVSKCLLSSLLNN